MNSMLAFGTYVPGKSCIHLMNAQVKVILACVFSICIFFVNTWIGLLLFALLVVAGYVFSGIKLLDALSGLVPVVLILVFTVAAHMVTGGSQEVHEALPGTSMLDCLQNVPKSAVEPLQGLASGLFVAGRIAFLVLACCLLSFTTSQMQLMRGLGSLLSPLRYLKIPVNDICLVISIALRFVPTITEEAYSLRRAYEVRGLSFAGLRNALVSWSKLLVPLFVRLFKRADRLAVALDARGCGAVERTSLHEFKMTWRDMLACMLGCLALVALAAVL